MSKIPTTPAEFDSAFERFTDRRLVERLTATCRRARAAVAALDFCLWDAEVRA